MSEATETTNMHTAVKQQGGATMLMLIILVVLVWAVIAYYMAMNSPHTEQSSTAESQPAAEQQVAVQEAVPAPAVPAPAGESAPQPTEQPAEQGDPMQQIMQVFAPEQK